MPYRCVLALTAVFLVLTVESAVAQPAAEGQSLDEAEVTAVLEQLRDALDAKNLPSGWVDELIADPPDIYFTSDLGDNTAIYQPAWQGPLGNGLSGDTINARPGMDPSNLTPAEIATLTHESFHAWFDFVPTYPFSEVSRFSDAQDEAIGGFIEDLVAGAGLQEAVSRAIGEAAEREGSAKDAVDAIVALENAWEGSFFANGFKDQNDVNTWVLLRRSTPEIQTLEPFLSAEDQQKIQDRVAERERMRDAPLEEEAQEEREEEEAAAAGGGTPTEPEPEPEEESPPEIVDPNTPRPEAFTPDDCPPCQPIADRLAAARKELAEQQTALGKLLAERKAVVSDIEGARKRIAGLERVLDSSRGTGGSSFDPGTGMTIDAWDQGDGTVKITTRDRNGNVLSERTRDANRHKARVRKALDRERAILEKLEAKKTAIEADIEVHRAKIAGTEARIQQLSKELAECIEKLCSGVATTDGAIGTGGLLIDPDALHGGSALASAGRDPAVQLMILEISPIELAPRAGHGAEAPRESNRFMQAFRPYLESQSPARGVRLYLESLGVSTGEAFTVRVFNEGGSAGTISGDGLVVEPLVGKVRNEVRKELGQLSGANEISRNVSGYCLEFLRQPPEEGTFFRVASAELQQKFAPVRNVLRASRDLLDAGGLHPDSDPSEYFHSIRQWAVWTLEQGFDADEFGEAFVERTQKNFEASDQDWTREIEGVVRRLVPNRWRDVQRILEAAGSPP